MSNQLPPTTAAQLYAEAGLIYIRAPSKVETKGKEQKKIRANPYPKDRNLITEQPKYNKGSGDYYSLLMGREFRPGRFVLLLDFDNKEEEGSENGMSFFETLKMESRGAPLPENTLQWQTLPLLCNRSAKGADQKQNNDHIPRR